MRVLLILVVLLLGCRGDTKTSSKPPAVVEPTGSASADPWQVAPRPDDPPSLDERHELAHAACPTVSGAFFYRVEKGGKVSHILGTRHVGVPLSKFPPPVHRAIESAKLAVFEVAPDDDSDIDQPEVLLPKELGPDLWNKYKALVGAEIAQSLERASPSVAVLSLMVMYEDIGATLDAEIERKVLAANIPAKGLESAEFQDRLLNEILDIRMLRASIQHTEDRAELAEESRKDLGEYCAGTDDQPGMDKDMRDELLASGYTLAELDRIDELMVYKRNEDWIPKLEKILAPGDVFVAVGADHLHGARGVVQLLEKRGFKLTRITK